MKTLLLLIAVLWIAAACSPTNSIAQVTPIVLESAEIAANPTIITASPIPPTLPPTNVPKPTLPYTPIPLDEDIDRGETFSQARATDTARNFVPDEPESFESNPFPLIFDDFYQDYDPYSQATPRPSFRLLSLDGKSVRMEGYMAPPLKLGLDWMMLTRFPVGACPYHSSTATWTPDIVLIYVDGELMPFTYEPIRVVGELHIGGTIDPETGMASLVRIYARSEDVTIIQPETH